jgi:hypothetical protein
LLTRTNAVFGALQRSQGFFDENGIAITSTVDLAAARKRLDDIVASFTTHAVDQDVNDRATRGESAKQRQLRVQLSTDIMRPIAEIARRDLRTTPEFTSLHMPRQQSGPAFLASAQGMLKSAAVHKDTLIQRGMPADFLEQFQTAIATFAACMGVREKTRTLRIGATQGLAAQEQEGRSVLKVLDALVTRALRGNPSLLATWQAARAIHRRPGGPATSSATPPGAEPTAAQAPASSTPAAPVATAAAA